MKPDVLFFSITNLFSVFTKLSLQSLCDCHELNLRYPNEEYSKKEHDLQQIQNIFLESFQIRGLLPEVFPLSFHAHLAGRIERFLHFHQPAMIFVEFQSIEEQELKILKHVQKFYDGPIAAYIPEDEKTKNKVYQLLTHGVKEIIVDYDERVFQNAFHRHTKSSSS